MDFETLLRVVGDEPVFETGLLLAGDVDAPDVQRQLSRWVTAGRVYQLRRGVYALAAPYAKARAHPFVVANRLGRGSYVSCQSALAYYGLIPEHAPAVTSVTVSRSGAWKTALGSFSYHHVKPELFWGYRALDMGAGLRAFVAVPEKALLDLIHLQPGGDRRSYLSEMRLQHLEMMDLGVLQRQAARAGGPKLGRAAAIVAELAQAEAAEYETL